MLALQVMFAAALMVLSSASDARAYMDPGTGSFAVQALIGSIASVVVAVRLFWGRITASLRGRRRDQNN